MQPRLRSAVVGTALAMLLLSGEPDASTAGRAPIIDATPSEDQEVSAIEVSLEPEMDIANGSRAQRERLEEAVNRFTLLGLALPDLEVVFEEDVESCGGHHAYFQPRDSKWRIRICSELEFLYEHELAHAWERANLTNEARLEFMALHEYSTWADKTVPWNERAGEWVAVVVQQGLAGLPLPAEISREHERRVRAFELLTGRPSSQLVAWCAERAARRDGSRPDVELCPSPEDQ